MSCFCWLSANIKGLNALLYCGFDPRRPLHFSSVTNKLNFQQAIETLETSRKFSRRKFPTPEMTLANRFWVCCALEMSFMIGECPESFPHDVNRSVFQVDLGNNLANSPARLPRQLRDEAIQRCASRLY